MIVIVGMMMVVQDIRVIIMMVILLQWGFGLVMVMKN